MWWQNLNSKVADTLVEICRGMVMGTAPAALEDWLKVPKNAPDVKEDVAAVAVEEEADNLTRTGIRISNFTKATCLVIDFAAASEAILAAA